MEWTWLTGAMERVKRVSEKVAERSVAEVCGCVKGWEACAKGRSLMWWRTSRSLVLGNGKVQHEQMTMCDDG